MYLMFDKVWNGEYNKYAVDSRIIGVETLYPIFNWIYLLKGIRGEGTFEYCTLHSNIVQHCLHVWPEERVWGSEEWNVEPVVPRAVKSAYALNINNCRTLISFSFCLYHFVLFKTSFLHPMVLLFQRKQSIHFLKF